MRKTLFVLAVIAFASMAAMGQHLVINEVQYDTPNGGTDTKTEWFELYNPTVDDIDLTGWKLCDNNDSIGEAFPSVVIAAGEYIVFAAVVDSFHGNFAAVPATQWSDSSIGGSGLSNTADMLVLIDPTNVVIDQINWGTYNAAWPSYIKFGCWTSGTIDPGAGHSVGRSPNGYDSDQASDIADFAAPTPGASNGGAVVYTPHTIYDIQFGGNLTDSTVSVVGVVTSAKTPDSGGGGAFAEASGPWHGIVIYGTYPVNRGDSLQINGTVAEFNGKTELIPAQIISRGTGTIPAATLVSRLMSKPDRPLRNRTRACWSRFPRRCPPTPPG